MATEQKTARFRAREERATDERGRALARTDPFQGPHRLAPARADGARHAGCRAARGNRPACRADLGILWYVERQEQERRRVSLLTDALWVEQTLRFQLGVEEDAVARLALDSGRWATNDEALLSSAGRSLPRTRRSPRSLAARQWRHPSRHPLRWQPSFARCAQRTDPAIPDRDHATVYGERAARVQGDRYVIDMAAPVADGSGRP